MGKYSLKKIYDVLSTTNFYTDKKRYLFAKLDKKYFPQLMVELSKFPDHYVEVINDKDELTLLVPNSIWVDELQSKLEYLEKTDDVALITCEVEEDTVTGFLQAIVSILSPNNIGVFVQGAYTTDHIFVDYDDLDRALELLNQLKDN